MRYRMEDIGGWGRKCGCKVGMFVGGVYGKCWDERERRRNVGHMCGSIFY